MVRLLLQVDFIQFSYRHGSYKNHALSMNLPIYSLSAESQTYTNVPSMPCVMRVHALSIPASFSLSTTSISAGSQSTESMSPIFNHLAASCSLRTMLFDSSEQI